MTSAQDEPLMTVGESIPGGNANTGVVSRRRAKRGNGMQLRAEIMDVAERLLVEKGDQDAVSIRSIADVIGITPPSVYLHFADKDELFNAVCNRRFSVLADVLEEARGTTKNPLEALKRCGQAYVRFALENPEQYALLMMTKLSNSAPESGLDSEMAGTRAFFGLVEAVEKCVKAGVFRKVDSYQTAITLWVSVHGATSLFITMANFPFGGTPEEVIDRIFDTQINGLKKTRLPR